MPCGYHLTSVARPDTRGAAVVGRRWNGALIWQQLFPQGAAPAAKSLHPARLLQQHADLRPGHSGTVDELRAGAL